MDVARFRRDDDASVRRLGDVVTQSPGDGIEGERPIDEPLDKFQTAHPDLPIGVDGPIGFVDGVVHDETLVHRRGLVARFTDLIIFSAGADRRGITRRGWSVLAGEDKRLSWGDRHMTASANPLV